MIGSLGMSNNARTSSSIALLVGVGMLMSACARVPGHQGFIVDTVLVDSVRPGVDNRQSVEKTLGRPTFVGQFGTNDYYYVGRDTKQLAFAQPRAVTQTALRIKFDEAGNVTAVDRTGLEKIAKINPENDKTPTLGRNRGFFEDLFGNIGQVGAVSQGGSTTDNPN
jgi:outer membrane protein assembly factor BamE (lipoprotein component of BamABCDE complex)